MMHDGAELTTAPRLLQKHAGTDEGSEHQPARFRKQRSPRFLCLTQAVPPSLQPTDPFHISYLPLPKRGNSTDPFTTLDLSQRADESYQRAQRPTSRNRSGSGSAAETAALPSPPLGSRADRHVSWPHFPARVSEREARARALDSAALARLSVTRFIHA